MADTLKVIAMPKDDPWLGLGGNDLDEYRNDIQTKAAADGFTPILDYGNVQDLLNRIRDLLNADPNHPCLEVLIILAHSSPNACNGLRRVNINGDWNDLAVIDFAQQLCGLKLCEAVKIYLNGCNTGLSNPWIGEDRSIAEILAGGLTKYNGIQFPHLMFVYGSNGYLYGMAMDHTERTEQTVFGAGATADAPMYNGARNTPALPVGSNSQTDRTRDGQDNSRAVRRR